MIVDSSVVLAILRREPEAEAFSRLLEGADRRSISAANYLEAAIVADGSRDPVLSRAFTDFFVEAVIAVEPVTQRQAEIARAAYRYFGKGSGHPAKLNFGDCFAYALAKDHGESLLFKGNDFARTDVRPALPPA